jgi:SAM-dependent methyltransferase
MAASNILGSIGLLGEAFVSDLYTYDHEWVDERVRLAGLECALDPGTHAHLLRLGLTSGSRCLEVGAGGGSVARWMAETVAPAGRVVAVDLETDFLEPDAEKYPCLEVRRQDFLTQQIPTGFDFVHARWLVEWLLEKRHALSRLAAALRPGGVLLIEEPDFVTFYNAAEPESLRKVARALGRYLESTTPVEVEYGRRAADDLRAVGLVDVHAEGRCWVVTGEDPFSRDFLRLTVVKVREPLLAGGDITELEYDEAVATLADPAASVFTPLTMAAWGRRAG